MVVCPACGHENVEGSRFCNACGSKLEAAPVSEERRTCTIVFCDLVGFTQRSESLDPEDVRQFLLPYYELMTEEVVRHGGAIDKLYGDGAMAVFGVPTAHEDDPERAIRASLKVLERLPALGLDLQARIGINTGEVVVSSDHAARGDALTGDTVNTASRVQSAAPVGGVVVGELTYAATKHVFDYDVLDPVELKGKAEPVPIYRPVAPIARVATEGPDVTPFVGRNEELRVLVEAFERSRSGTPTFVTVVADPGIGKSRLLREFGRSVEDLPDLVTWRQGRCLSYGEGISFWALGEIVKSHAGILDTDGQDAIARKLDAVLTEPDEQTRSWIKDRLAPLVGLHTTTAAPERGELFAAWRRFFATLAAEEPLVLVIEDLHWADALLVEFLTDLRASLIGLPVLVLATARPELAERHPSWLDGTEVRLHALDPEPMHELVAASLPGASTDFVDAVCAQAGGSPLYAEQLAAMRRTMPIAGGSEDDLPIPPTIQALLAARIDQLPPELHATLLDASVVGKTFWTGAVAALGELDGATTSERLRALEEREFIRAEPSSTIDGETEFAFVHALMKDVAYGRLSRRPRYAKHAATASWISNRVGHPLGDIAEIVVAHLDGAKDAAQAAGLTDAIARIDSDLVDALKEAADQAERTDMETAKRFAERALSLVQAGDPRRPSVLLSAGSLICVTGDLQRGMPLIDEAIPGLRDLEAWDELGGALQSLAAETLKAGDEVRSEELLLAARQEMEAHPGEGLAGILREIAVRGWMYGEVDEAAALLDRSDELTDLAGKPRNARAIAIRGEIAIGQQRTDEGVALVLQAADQALAGGDGLEAAMILNDLGSTTTWHGTFERSLELLERSAAIASERGLDGSIAQSPRMRVMYHLGRWDEILEQAPPLIALGMRLGNEWTAEGIRMSLARVQLDRGGAYLDQIDEAAFVPTAFTTNLDPILWAISIDLQRLRGRVELDPLVETLDTTERLYPSPVLVEVLLRCDELAIAERVSGMEFPEESFAALSDWNHGLIALAHGDAHRGEELLASARADASEHGSKVSIASLDYHLGRCAILEGEADLARVRLNASREAWSSMHADLRVAEVAEALAQL